MNAENQRQAAIYLCEKCPRPKMEYDWALDLTNGVCLSLFCRRCESPDAECTDQVQSNLPAETPHVANTVFEWLADQDCMKLLGVSSWTCGDVRSILTYPTPSEAKMVAAIGSIAVPSFRQSGRGDLVTE
jgi:hypothetical protein